MHPEIIKAWLHDVVVKRPFDEDEEQIYNHSQQATRAQAIMSSPPQTPSPFKKRKLRGNADNDKMPEAQDSAQTQTQTRVVGAPDAASPRASTSASVSSSFAVPAYYPPPSWTYVDYHYHHRRAFSQPR
ncbi:hypothetical protein OE88DRAFT_1659883 [Heliocybe sulcata]|uniref:Uncharacterized protein n=1 Tax=Heliocybe sulcata TaxID=5364 RepID=A0A5C3NAE3_9AGAM|nr:hypothetical protein OE88DRAFT_1659883 [Heliocybe sulcata]